jgi:LysR family transcriptional regulator, mexEF-oprN operon transcriptional activator
VPVSLLWHASYDRDPAHVWLRQTFARFAQETSADHGSTCV